MKKPAKIEELNKNLEIKQDAKVAGRLHGHVDKITTYLTDIANNWNRIAEELLAVRDEGDYAGTFEGWVKETFGKTRDWAYKLIDAFETKKALPAHVEHEIQNPRTAVALASAPIEKRAAIVSAVKDSGKKITSKTIKAEVDRQKVIEAEVVELDELGKKIPAELLPEWNRAKEESKWARGLINQVQKWFSTGMDDTDGKKRDPIFRGVTLSNLKLFTDIKRQVAMVDPYAVCPTCKGAGKNDGKKCGQCKGVGFISKFEFENASKKKEPKEKKSAAKAK